MARGCFSTKGEKKQVLTSGFALPVQRLSRALSSFPRYLQLFLVTLHRKGVRRLTGRKTRRTGRKYGLLEHFLISGATAQPCSATSFSRVAVLLDFSYIRVSLNDLG